MDDDLRGLVRLGLQQDRVHVRMKFRTAGEGLQGLSPADLPAVRRHRRVVGHVLWLEGKDAKAAISKDPAKPGHKDGRSEEHTSELQSLMRISYAVLCLKKNNKTEYKK